MLQSRGFLVVELKSPLLKFYGCHHGLVNRYGISLSQMTVCPKKTSNSSQNNTEQIKDGETLSQTLMINVSAPEG
jgi:hypothetical protein